MGLTFTGVANLVSPKASPPSFELGIHVTRWDRSPKGFEPAAGNAISDRESNTSAYTVACSLDATTLDVRVLHVQNISLLEQTYPISRFTLPLAVISTCVRLRKRGTV